MLPLFRAVLKFCSTNRLFTYIKELYDDPKRTNIPVSFEGDLSGPEILELEIEQAVKQLKAGKATGQDNISCEMLRTLGQDGLGALCKLFNQTYNQVVFPEEMCQSVFVPLPKSPEYYYVKNTELLV